MLTMYLTSVQYAFKKCLMCISGKYSMCIRKMFSLYAKNVQCVIKNQQVFEKGRKNR